MTVALGQRRRSAQKFVPPKLMLTSMMDMFTIILIFLLFSFSESPEKIKLGEDLQLPRSTAEAKYHQALKIILTKTELRVDDEVVAMVHGQKVEGLSSADFQSSTLYKRLKHFRADAKDKKGDGTEQPPHVLFLCDKSHSFKTINSVIKTSGLAGYPNFQFGVLEAKNK
jgi:biopolymer transport protein ExbD